MRNRVPKTLWRAVVAISPLALLALFACDLIESAQAEKVLAATVLATPSKDFSNILQAPADAGLPPDAGMNLGDAGWASIPQQTVAQVFFGDRDPANPGAKPTGVSGAKVKLAFGGKSFDFKDSGSGNYTLTTAEAADFKYVPNVEYTLTVVASGETYTATVTGPQEEKITEFNTNPPKPVETTANTGVKLTRSGTQNIAFTTVIPASQQGQGKPTYTDLPSTPLDLLNLVANDGEWKKPQITIPGSAFPQADTYYLVNVSAVAKGTTSNNLFTASVLMVGTADMGLVKTK